MHAASPARSLRLMKALSYLSSCRSIGCTTAELQAFTGSMAPATDVSELRAAGHLVDCRRDGTTKGGRKVYRYTYQGRRFE